MIRAPFYAVPPDSYLFRAQLPQNDERAQREEPVRQWCAFELMRAYGLKLSELQFEYPVKVGSKTYWIDVVVLRRGQPWIVVECKEPEFKRHENALEQAVSYAGSAAVGAEFAIYTNGDAWLVRRRVRDLWVSIPDLPHLSSDHRCETIVDLLSTLKELCPLLHQLDQETKGATAHRYMDAMQRFFVGTNLITQDADQNLLIATDHVLRSLAIHPSDDYYRRDKFGRAVQAFEEFVGDRKLKIPIAPFAGDELRVEMLHLHASLMNLVENVSGLTGIDVLLIRLNAALTEYGQKVGVTKKSYPLIDHHIHEVLRHVLEFGLKVHLNLTLPDPLDQIWKGDMREYCRSAWETFDIDPHDLTPWRMVAMTIRAPFERMLFWKKDR